MLFCLFTFDFFLMSFWLANYPDVSWSADRVVSGKRYFGAQRSTYSIALTKLTL
jgi:hypothetical protein